ncbi:MAG: response regulator transcription factor [Anaerolineales bacterium]|nr:response regulator transcription factor [Anaerolineales bacterium]
MKPIRIVVVDDHAVLRDGIVSILNAEPDFEVVGEAGSVAEGVAVVRSTGPDVVLMDYSLPDGTGLDAIQQILPVLPQTQVVLLTMHEEDDLLFAAIRSGANGYLLKNISAREMLARLRNVASGQVAISPTHTKRLFSEFARSEPAGDSETTQLTSRELEVLQLLAQGAANQEIAQTLSISIHTVKNHVHRILEKLEADNRREAVEIATRKRLI